MNILICPDKFKGALPAENVADEIEAGILKTTAAHSINKIPLADGGEGTDLILSQYKQAEYIRCLARDPLQREIQTGYYLNYQSKEAIIGMSAASGWDLLNRDERNPMKTNTAGTGDLLMDAIKRGAEKVIICVGGSATNDGGAGLLHACGFEFFDASGTKIIPVGENLHQISEIHVPSVDWPETIIAHDVLNPLLGLNGATLTYARQKGANEGDLVVLESGLENLCKIMNETEYELISQKPGMGAAGGISLSLVSYMKADLIQGFELVSNACGLEAAITWADLVITGEGQVDSQSESGKVVGEIEKMCTELNKEMIIICGQNRGYSGKSRIFALSDYAKSQEDSISRSAELLNDVASKIF